MPAAESFTLISSFGELEMGLVPAAIPCPPPPLSLPPLPPNMGSASAVKTSSSSGSGASSREDELRAQFSKLRRTERDPSATPIYDERPRDSASGLGYSGYSHAAESSDELEPFVSLGPGRRGLMNFGATCYANSVFQVLANTAPLLNAFLLHVPGILFLSSFTRISFLFSRINVEIFIKLNKSPHR